MNYMSLKLNIFGITQGKKPSNFFILHVLFRITQCQESQVACGWFTFVMLATDVCHFSHQLFPMCAANTLSPHIVLKAHCYLCTSSVISFSLVSAECNRPDFVYTVFMFVLHNLMLYSPFGNSSLV